MGEAGSGRGRPPFFSRISIRLLAFNLLLVFLPAVSFLYLDTYERQLLRSQERSMVQQGRILAAALAEEEEVDEQVAERLLIQLEQRLTSRLRVLDADGRLLADTSRLGPRLEPGEEGADDADAGVRDNFLYRMGAGIFQLWERLTGVPITGERYDEGFYSPSQPFSGPEVRAALAGRYGATTRPTPGQRSLTLYSAIPVRNGDRVVGAVLVSQSTLRLLRDLYEVRLAIFKAFLASVAAAVVLSLLVSTTIARPLQRLRREAAELLDRRGRLRGRFGGSRRRDEIGALARALEDLSGRLEEHLRFTEAFAADVSHEFKNPLASIRTATEMLSQVEDADERQRFVEMVQAEVARLERLLSSVREITSIDTQIDDEERRPVPVAALLERLVEAFRLRGSPALTLTVDEVARNHRVSISPDRLAQVFENLLDNARSFSPPDREVVLDLFQVGEDVVVRVSDQGPGIPPEHLEQIFGRFFSYRPGDPRAKRRHSGLGLAISRAIVEAYGGELTAANGANGGAVFTVRLPVIG